LGISVGANPRTWNPAIESMKKDFLGGMVIIYPMEEEWFQSIWRYVVKLLFYFSFFKAPRKVINELTLIHRRFGENIRSIGLDKIKFTQFKNSQFCNVGFFMVA